MANVVQWSVDQLYREIQSMDAAGRQAIVDLSTQKLELQNAYTAARNAGNQVAMDFLKPLISKNSALRIKAGEFKAQFNNLVNQASSVLRGAGFTVPNNISGMGFGPALIIVPAAVIATALIVWGIIHELDSGKNAINQALTQDGPRLLTIAANPNATADERKAATDAYKKLLDDAGIANSSDWMTMVVPALGLVALIALGPTILKMLPSRGGAK